MNKAVVVTLANGMANSGYIYSEEAYSHLTFQVIGSRLQPGCAEGCSKSLSRKKCKFNE
ncbi:MAG TPA: hypothetical protein VH325_08715 [Bryobacteraceae bacterium]|nr:hypothetical protein [Bryobacteraceae bacterium]